MRTLYDFQAPTDGEVTLCEVDGRIHSANFEFTNVNIFTNSLENYPQIHIMKDSLYSNKLGDDAKELFISVEIPFLKQLVQIYYEQGYVEMLQAAASHRKFLISNLASILLKTINGFDNIRTIFNPTFKQSRTKIITKISLTRNWVNSPIRCIAWHPDYVKIAVGICDDTVKIYQKNSTLIPILKCKQQKNITCIKWRPMSDSEIAVACEECIIIWNVDPHSVVTRPSVSNAIILQRNNHQPIVSIAWSPHGDMLASVAAQDSVILVWDVEFNRTSSLKRPGCSGNSLLQWAPNGKKLFSATTTLVFRVWECQTWKAERWNVLTDRVQAASWSPCGSTLLFSTTQEPIIYALSFIKSDFIFAHDFSSSPNAAIPLYDVSKVDIEGIIIGGIIQNMDWDPAGNHLAVIFADTSYVAVFSVILDPVLQLNPRYSFTIGLK
ncbi:translation initiation factor eIF2A [Oryctes borbonicus]|uniref:Translation initiation factor eIF2A n=1 Tax=Oryctes borbonicus TaxID=1629725 RepID=A0A0T6ATP1_9SCAR|nr:translation initiation factor eIF2A [Oryctes borbonicus]